MYKITLFSLGYNNPKIAIVIVKSIPEGNSAQYITRSIKYQSSLTGKGGGHKRRGRAGQMAMATLNKALQI